MKYFITNDLTKEEKEEYSNKGLFCYELRLDDFCNNIATIEKHVWVNHFGSIITNEEIKFEENSIDKIVDYNEFIKDNIEVFSIDDLLVKEEPLKYYETKEIIKLIKSKERLVYVDDGCDELIIRYKDIPECINDLYWKFGTQELKIYDYQDNGLLVTTSGPFLFKCDQDVRKDIIDRMVDIQLNLSPIKEYKVMDEYTIETAKEEISKTKNKHERNDR